MRVSNWASAKLLALSRPNSNPDPSRNLSLNLRCKSRTWAVEAIGAERSWRSCALPTFWPLLTASIWLAQFGAFGYYTENCHLSLTKPVAIDTVLALLRSLWYQTKIQLRVVGVFFAACWSFPGCRRPTGRKYAKRSKYLDCLKLLFNFLSYSSPQKTRCIGLSLFMAFAQCHL